jgi:hypothetical protein
MNLGNCCESLRSRRQRRGAGGGEGEVIAQSTLVMTGFQTHLDLKLSVCRLKGYECTKADSRIRQGLKTERGLVCEKCQVKLPVEELAIHHIIETRIHPEYAREPLNMIVLCPKCHSEVTEAERFGISSVCLFCSSLPAEIRERHVAFLERTAAASPEIVGAFRAGNSDYWNDRVVRDLTR